MFILNIMAKKCSFLRRPKRRWDFTPLCWEPTMWPMKKNRNFFRKISSPIGAAKWRMRSAPKLKGRVWNMFIKNITKISNFRTKKSNFDKKKFQFWQKSSNFDKKKVRILTRIRFLTKISMFDKKCSIFDKKIDCY